jgi:hypothetical protein
MSFRTEMRHDRARDACETKVSCHDAASGGIPLAARGALDVRALGAIVGNRQLSRLIASRRRLQRVRVLKVEVDPGASPGEITSELVEFSERDSVPDPHGRRENDPYTYEHVEGSHYRRRRRAKVNNDELRGSTVYKALDEAFKANPLSTPAELKLRAEAVKGSLELAAVRDATEQFFNDFFEYAIRFSADWGLTPKSKTTETFHEHRVGGEWPEPTLKAAAAHMAQNSDLSNMLSLALSEGALLRNAGREVCQIMYDPATTGKRAPFIYEFLVPKASLITPQTPRLPLAGLDAFRSKSETEALFYGGNLAKYIVGQRVNPYTEEDQARIQESEKLRAEESADVQLPANRPYTIKVPAMRANWANVGPILVQLGAAPLPANATAQATAVAQLLQQVGGGAASFRAINSLDDTVRALANTAPGHALVTGWNTIVQPYLKTD